MFELVERIRRTGVQFHRNADEAARQELQTIMSGLPTDQALRIIRAFGYFSHLANLAEDQHHIRRTRAYAMAKAPPRQGTMAYALDRARKRRHLPRSNCRRSSPTLSAAPVLTAHPTEVRRKSSIDREMEIARLLDERDRVEFTPEELAANRRALRRAVLTLWQTSLVRGKRLRVIDEVANGLAYYDHTFLHALPVFYADLEDRLGAIDPAWRDLDVPSFLRMGSWIGGDRDGNPFVTADVTASGARHAKPAGAALLSRGAASAGRRIAARRSHRARLRGLARAGGALARPFVGTPGRALPARHRRHLREAGCHRVVARQARSAAPAGRTGAGL